MKQKDFILEGHGVSCYSGCHTDSDITYGRQEVTKEHLTNVGCSKTLSMDGGHRQVSTRLVLFILYTQNM